MTASYLWIVNGLVYLGIGVRLMIALIVNTVKGCLKTRFGTR
jgi:hypothetical protein